MYKVRGNAVDVETSINSGQVFLWTGEGGTWHGINGTDVLRVREDPPDVRSAESGTYDLFRLSDDYSGILERISGDGTVAGAVSRFSGLRLLRQDPFQCMISFIVSANSNIQRIRRSLRLLCSSFGGRLATGGSEFRTFPEPQSLAAARQAQLLACGLGYRAPFVQKAAAMVAGGDIDLGRLRAAGYRTAQDALLQVPGIGSKVADCTMLFSLDKLEAFPLDRWMLRVLARHYSTVTGGGSLTPARYEGVRQGLVERFGPCAGYAQQFLFKMAREDDGKSW